MDKVLSVWSVLIKTIFVFLLNWDFQRFFSVLLCSFSIIPSALIMTSTILVFIFHIFSISISRFLYFDYCYYYYYWCFCCKSYYVLLLHLFVLNLFFLFFLYSYFLCTFFYKYLHTNILLRYISFSFWLLF